jgi:LAO/AO transport system kinase
MGSGDEISGLVEKLLAGDRRSLARLISAVENEPERARPQLEKIHPRIGRARRLGVTGPPGSGKSTLVDALTLELRRKGLAVGIIAIDPTSPFTGGALLGDRIRMQRIGLDPGVFIRSMATRGHLGGLCAAAGDAADLLDAFGKDIVITETVGVGQSEVEIVRVADTTIVVLCPEVGDAVQTLKAGLMEIADVFVVNKADREGAGRLVLDIRGMLDARTREDESWRPPVVETSATKGTGIDALRDALERHGAFLREKGRLEGKRLAAAARKIRDLVLARVQRDACSGAGRARLEEFAREVAAGRLTPQAAADEMFEKLAVRKGKKRVE